MTKYNVIYRSLILSLLASLGACGDDPQPVAAVVPYNPNTVVTTVPTGVNWYTSTLTLNQPITIKGHTLNAGTITWSDIYMFTYNVANTCAQMCASTTPWYNGRVSAQVYGQFSNILWLNFNYNNFASTTGTSYLTVQEINLLKTITITYTWAGQSYNYNLWTVMTGYLYSVQTYYYQYVQYYYPVIYSYYPSYYGNNWGGNYLNLGLSYNTDNMSLNIGGLFGF